MKTLRHSGKSLTGIKVNPHQALGFGTLGELQHFGLKQPTWVAKLKKAGSDPDDLVLKEFRALVQRTWDKSRSIRADNYAGYIDKVERGDTIGGTPPINLYVSEAGTHEEDGITITFPWSAKIIAIDGETQLEARFRLGQTEDGQANISYVLWHGISEDHAMQILYDFNNYAQPISPQKLGFRNSTGPLSHTIQQALEKSGLDDSIINQVSQVANKKTYLSFTQAMTFVAAHEMGPQAEKQSVVSRFSELNKPTAMAVNGHCVDSLADMMKAAESDKSLGKAPGIVWQAAGVLTLRGKSVQDLHFDKAQEAVAESRVSGRGGLRLPFATRMASVLQAMGA